MSGRIGPGIGAGGVDGRGGDVGAHHHAGAAAGRRVVDRAMLVGGEIADVDGLQRPFAFGERLAGEARRAAPETSRERW